MVTVMGTCSRRDFAGHAAGSTCPACGHMIVAHVGTGSCVVCRMEHHLASGPQTVTEDALTAALTGFNVDINDHGFTASGLVDNPAVAARALLARLSSARPGALDIRRN